MLAEIGKAGGRIIHIRRREETQRQERVSSDVVSFLHKGGNEKQNLQQRKNRFPIYLLRIYLHPQSVFISPLFS